MSSLLLASYIKAILDCYPNHDIMIELIVYGSMTQAGSHVYAHLVYLLQEPSKGPHNITNTGPLVW
jgi:hypothetical protein